MIQCGKCSTQNPQGSKFCKHCGADLSIWKPGSSLAPTPSAQTSQALPAASNVNSVDLQAAVKSATAQLEAQLASAKQELQIALADLAKAPDEKAFTKAQADLASANLQIQQLGQEVTAKQAEISRLNQALQQQGGNSAALAQVERELAQAQRDLKVEKQRASAEELRLADEVGRQSTRADRAEANRRAGDAEVARLRAVEQDLRRQVHDLETNLNDWRTIVSNLTTNNPYFKYVVIGGAGVLLSCMLLGIVGFVFGASAALVLLFIGLEAILHVKAPSVFFNPKLTVLGWVATLVPTVILTLGVMIQIGGNPTVPVGGWMLYMITLVCLLATRAEK